MSPADRGAQSGPALDAFACHDASCTIDSAIMERVDGTLQKIAHELVDVVRRDANTD